MNIINNPDPRLYIESDDCVACEAVIGWSYETSDFEWVRGALVIPTDPVTAESGIRDWDVFPHFHIDGQCTGVTPDPTVAMPR